MTRFDLSVLSQAHSVALTAMVAPETKAIPIAAARELHRRVEEAQVPLSDECARFTAQLHMAHGDLSLVASAGRLLRDAVARQMAYTPPDAGRVDIHG